MPNWIPAAPQTDPRLNRYEVEYDDNADHRLVQHSDRYRYRVRKAHPTDKDRPWWKGTPNTTQENTSQVDTELSYVWGQNNPELFVDAVQRFQEEHSHLEWAHSVEMRRSGFITLKAKKRKPISEEIEQRAFDMEQEGRTPTRITFNRTGEMRAKLERNAIHYMLQQADSQTYMGMPYTVNILQEAEFVLAGKRDGS